MTMEELTYILSGIHPYVTAIHLREKQRTARELYQTINLLTKAKIPLEKLIINDRIDVALATGVNGVQLAFHSLDVSVAKVKFPGLAVGCSIHSMEEGQRVSQNGADYVLYGHIFPSSSKSGLKPRGLGQLKRLTESLTIPVIAIGGITPENAIHTIHHGAAGIAVMSGILQARDPVSAAKAYKRVLQNGDV